MTACGYKVGAPTFKVLLEFRACVTESNRARVRANVQIAITSEVIA
jgi:hypothetical protein